MFGRSTMRWSVGRGGGRPFGSSAGKTSANFDSKVSISGASTSTEGVGATASRRCPFFFFFRPRFTFPPAVAVGDFENRVSTGAASYIFATARLSSSVGSGNGISPVAVTGVGS